MRSCIFCKENKVSREHVLSSWIFNKKENKSSITPAAYVSAIDGPYVVQRFENKILERPEIGNSNFVCRCVCENCNNGWMSQLDSNAKNFVVSSNWGEIDPNPNSYDADLLLRWMMLKFLIFCQSVGYEKIIDDVLYDKVFRGENISPVHFDYYLGSHDSVDFSLTQAIPFPEADEALIQKILSHCVVFSAQLGKIYLRLLMSDVNWRNELVLMRFKTKPIRTNYEVSFNKGVSDPTSYIGRKEEYLLFCNSVLMRPIA